MKSSKKQKKNNIKKFKKNNELVKCSDEIIKLIESNTMIELFEYEKQIIEKNECFICFEIIIEDELEPIQLKNQKLYIKNCNCNGYVHKMCLDKWYNTNNKCPICRENINKKVDIILTYTNYNGYLIVLYLYVKKIFFLSWFIMVYIIVYFICDLILSSLHFIKNGNYNIIDINDINETI
jgi:hypothetical protein